MDSQQINQTIKEIENFLQPFKDFWSIEILNNYPNTYQDSIEQMAEDLQNFDSFELASWLNSESSNLPLSLKDFSKNCQEISYIPKSSKPPIKILSKFQISNKKRHELAHLIAHIDPSGPILDFAGGTGHLSQQFNNYSNQQAVCLDNDEYLLKKGRKRFDSDCVHFKNFSISPNIDLEHTTHSVVALHNCGNLSDYVLDFFKRNSNTHCFYNIGCCYHKCKNDYKDSLPLSNHAKTLAIRSSFQTPEEIEKRIQVKKFRYTFELLLKEYYQIPHTSSLLSSTQEFYKKDFQYYANQQLFRLKLTSTKNLNSFYKREDISKKVDRLIRLGFIRLYFSRILEKVIIYHRAKKLSSISSVQIHEIFDFKVSPRNILLSATR